MKKPLTINLSGMVFHIDNDAYEKLKIYLDSIENHFANEEERREILADIETRIAEIFQGKINDNKQIITEKDVDEVIEIMGDPEEFGDVANGKEGGSKKGKYTTSGYRRLYRDTENRILGGVCSGMGAYFRIDPLILRILFVIAFLGFLSGLLIYIILWIVIPEAKTTAQKLEMKGEPVTISSIGKAVKEEFENVKKNIKKTMNL